jgi:hypothetical protein
MDLGGVRRWQTLCEAKRLRDEVCEWVTHRKSLDINASRYRGRYDTQLEAISSKVLDAVERVRWLSTNYAIEARTPGQICTDYNLHDQRLVWMRYAWGCFRDKLDQRDDDAES